MAASWGENAEGLIDPCLRHSEDCLSVRHPRSSRRKDSVPMQSLHLPHRSHLASSEARRAVTQFLYLTVLPKKPKMLVLTNCKSRSHQSSLPMANRSFSFPTPGAIILQRLPANAAKSSSSSAGSSVMRAGISSATKTLCDPAI